MRGGGSRPGSRTAGGCRSWSWAQHAVMRSCRADSKSCAQVPARHHRYTRSPRGRRVVSSTAGSFPPREWIQAPAHPARTRCGVITHHARAINTRRAGGHSATTAISATHPASTQAAAGIRAAAITPDVIPAASISSYRHRQARTSGLGRATGPTAACSPASACRLWRGRSGGIVIALTAPLCWRSDRGPGGRCPGNGGTACHRRQRRRRDTRCT